MHNVLGSRFLFDASLAKTVHASAEHAQHPVSSSQGPTSLVFIDTRVAGYQTLTQVKSGTEVVLVSSNDGLSKITQALQGKSGIKDISIVGYGTPGSMVLGNTVLSGQTIEGNKDVAGIQSHLASDAIVTLYGCDVSVDSGLVKTLGSMTHADVYASDKVVGNGDWTVKDSKGKVLSDTPFTDDALRAYKGVLDAPNPVVTGSSTSPSVMAGDTFTETVSLTNMASAATGYTPFLNVYVPHNDTVGATLSSAQYLGSNLNVTSVALTTQNGVVGAVDPLQSGNVFVAAPSGYKAGDMLYVVKMPLSSLASGQAIKNISLNFVTDTSSSPTSLSGDAINIATIGGFATGSTPSYEANANTTYIRGTDLTQTDTSTSDNGLVTTTLPINLVDVSVTASTVTGENNNPVGPQNPLSYTMTIKPSPVTQGNPLTHYTATMTLPDNMTYTGEPITVNGSKGVVTVNGQKITVSFDSLSSADGSSTLTVPVYATETLTNANNHYGAVINPPTVTYQADNWASNGQTGSVSGTGDTSGATVAVRAFTVDDHASDTNSPYSAFPGDTNAHTVNTNQSANYQIDNAVLSVQLGDGQTIDPNTTYKYTYKVAGSSASTTLTFALDASTLQTQVINGQTVYTQGHGNTMSFSRDASTGITTINFNLSAEKKAEAAGTGIFAANTVGSLTYNTKILTSYTTGQSAPLSEGNVISDVATMNADVVDNNDVVLGNSGNSSSMTQKVPSGSVSLGIAAVDGDTNNQTVSPGSVVTYNETYHLVTGNYDSLSLQAYVPQGIFSVSDPAQNGSNLTFTQGSGLNVGEYRLVNAPDGVTITKVTANPSDNSLTFTLSGHNGVPVSGSTVQVEFSLKTSTATNNADVAITSQAVSTLTSANTVTTESAALNATVAVQPAVTTKTGIVSVVNSSGSADGSVSYTNETTGASGSPTSVYAPAGSNYVFTGDAPTSLADADNLDVSSVSGGETVRVATTVKGGSSVAHGDVYNLVVKGSMPSGLTLADINDFRIVRSDGVTLSYTTVDGKAATIADYFSNGLLLKNNGQSILTAGGASSVLTIVYDVSVPQSISLGHTNNFASSVVSYTNAEGLTGYVRNGAPVGGTASDLTDKASVALQSPSLSKVLGASSDTTDDNAGVNAVVAGNVRPVSIIMKLPPGALTNASSDGTSKDVTVTETIPDGMAIVNGSVSIALGNGVQSSATPSYTISGNTITFDFGSILENTTSEQAQVTLGYKTYVTASHNQGDSFTSTASLSYDGSAVANAGLTMQEYDPNIALSVTDSANGNYYSGQTVQYSVSAKNTTNVTAYDTVVSLASNSNLVIQTVKDASGNVVYDRASGVGSLTLTLGQMAANSSVNYTVDATINSGLSANSPLSVSANGAWDSVAKTYATNNGSQVKSYTSSGQDASVTQDMQTRLYIVNDNPNNPNALDTAAGVSVGSQSDIRGVVQLPPGKNTNVTLTLNLPNGVLVDLSAIKIGLITPGGNATSSTLDASGTDSDTQIAEGNTQVNPYTVALKKLLPSSIVSSVTNADGSQTVTIKLGDMTNPSTSPLKSYIAFDYESQIANIASNVDGTVVGATLETHTDNGAWSSEAQGAKTYQVVKEPKLTLTKQVLAIDEASGTVQVKDTITNTGSSSAFNVQLQDVVNGLKTGNIASVTINGQDGSVDANGKLTGSWAQIAAGSTVSVTYTLKVNTVQNVVPDMKASVTYQSVAGTATGASNEARDGSGTLPVDNYIATDTLGFGVVSGQIWNSLGSDPTAYNAYSTPLSGVNVTGQSSGQYSTLSLTATTDANGRYIIGLVPTGVFTVNPASVNSNETEIFATSPSVQIGKETSATVNQSFALPNSAPVLTNGEALTIDNQGSASNATKVFPNTDVHDAEMDKIGYGNSVLTVSRLVNGVFSANSDDNFIITPTGSYTQSNNSILNNGVVVATFSHSLNAGRLSQSVTSSGILRVTFANTATQADVQAIVRMIGYYNNSNVIASQRVIGLSLTDGNTSNVSKTGSPSGDEGTGGAKTTLLTTTVNENPVYGNSAVTFDEQNNTQGSPVLVFASNTSTVEANTLTQATFTIGHYVNGQDNLSLLNSTSGVTASWDASSGVLTVTNTSMKPNDFFQYLKANVAYTNTSSVPDVSDRSIAMSLTFGGQTYTRAALSSVSISPTDDSPILNSTGTLNAATQNSGETPATPVGLVGTSLADLISGTNITDSDGPGLVNGQTTTQKGVVIEGADTTHGTWYVTTDGGKTWSVMQSVSESNALHLTNDPNNRIEFVPTQAYWNGVITNALTIRAWDGYDNVPNGTYSALPASPLGVGRSGDGVAYSSNTLAVSETVTAVNDAPFFTQGVSMTSVENNPTVYTVNDLFGSSFSDQNQNQRSAQNPSGSVADNFYGIAFTGNQTPFGEGSLQYLSGNTWITVGSVSDTSAVVLGKDVKIRFLGTENFNGQSLPYTARLIDTSSTAYTNTSSVYTQQDVSHNGGPTSISGDTKDFVVTVTPVHNAPIVVNPEVSVGPSVEDSSGTITTVRDIFGGSFNSDADQQQTTINPTGTTKSGFYGVALTGMNVPSTEGTLSYSTDKVTWVTIAPNSVSDASSLILSADTYLRFSPVTNFNGATPDITARLIDTTSSLSASDNTNPVFADTRVNGGSTALSQDTVGASYKVTAVNNAPIASGTNTLPSTPEETNTAPVTVGDIFAANFSDNADQQQTVLNPTGSVANTLQAIAINGNTVPANEGVYRYSTDNVHWTPISNTVSDKNALVLGKNVFLEFVPAQNFNGVPTPLSSRLIENSTSVYTDANGVYEGQDVSANGGTSSISQGSVTTSVHVTFVNHAPTIVDYGSMPDQTEDVAAPGVTVGSIFDKAFSDSADQQQTAENTTGSVASTLQAVAIVFNNIPSSEGVLMYGSGDNWTAFPPNLSDKNALVLGRNVEIKFVSAPNFNGQPQLYGARLIESYGTHYDANTIATGQDVSTNGESTSISDGIASASLNVIAVNDAPIAENTGLTYKTTENSIIQIGAVSNLSSLFNDSADQQQSSANPYGSVANTFSDIAINGVPSSSIGVLQYSVDGKTWTSITTASDTQATVLGTQVQMRFVPAENYNGNTGISLRVIDSSTTQYGNPLGVYTQQDVTKNGGSTAISAQSVPVAFEYSYVHQAPKATGNTALPTTQEDVETAPASVGTLFGNNFQNAVNQNEALQSIALTNNPVPASEGVLRYSTDNGATYQDVPTNLTDKNALVLGKDVLLKFVPAQNFNGATPDIQGHVVDGSDANYTDNHGAYAGQDVSVNGGTTSVSSGVVSASIAVKAINNAPIILVNEQVVQGVEDTGVPAKTVAQWFSGSYDDSADQQQSALNPTGSVSSPFNAVAITSVPPASMGVWSYSKDGSSYTDITSVSDTNALVLGLDVSLKFTPAPNFNGRAQTLGARFLSSYGSSYAPDAVVAGQDVSHNGGATDISGQTQSVVVAIKAVNDNPVASGNVNMGNGLENNPAIISIGSLYSNIFSNIVDQQQTPDNPTGSVAHSFQAVAFTGNTTPQSEGVWRVSSDREHWTTLGSLSDTSSVVIGTSGYLEFLPAQNFNGAPQPLTMRLIDSASTLYTTQTGVLVNQDISQDPEHAVSNAVQTNIAIMAVHNAPIVSGTSSLPETQEGAETTPVTIGSLMSGHFDNSADQQKTDINPTGSVPSPYVASAIVGSTTPSSEGVYRFSVDGKTWSDIPTTLTESNALLLGGNVLIKFVPAPYFNGQPQPLVMHGLDSTTGLSLDSVAYGDVGTLNGGDTGISAGTLTVTTTVQSVHNAPDIAQNAFSYTTPENVPVSLGTVADLASAYVDAHDKQQTALNPTGSVGDSYQSFAITQIPPAQQGVVEYLNDGVWTAITQASETNATVLGLNVALRFVPGVNQNGDMEPVLFHVIDNTGPYSDKDGVYTGQDVSMNGGTTAISAQTAALNIHVDYVHQSPSATGDVQLNPVAENNDTTPSTVGALFDSHFVNAVNQNNVLQAVAIVGNTTPASEGTWMYSVGGSPYTPVGSVSDTNALVLGRDVSVKFVPAPNFNGKPQPLSVRLVDNETSTYTDATGVYAGQDVTHNGGNTSITPQIIHLDASITAVHSAPQVTGMVSVVTQEDVATQPQTVGSLYDPVFSNAVDQQQTPQNETGSVASTLQAVAIIGGTSSASGTWMYNDHGTVVAMGSVSEANALVLGRDVSVFFVPNKDFNGHPPVLLTRLIDSTSSYATDGVYQNQDTRNNGGTTALSAQVVTTDVTVTPVNNAPIASGVAVLANGVESSSSIGERIGDIYIKNYSDSADQQRTQSNPTGSVESPFTAIGVVGNTVPAQEGVYQYSTDGGVSYHDISTSVSNTQALVLGTDIRIRFEPAPYFNGVPPALTVRLIEADTRYTTTTVAAGQDISVNGGTSTVSADVVETTVTVQGVHNAPVVTGPVTLSTQEDSATQPQTVGALFGPVFDSHVDQQQTAQNITGSVASSLQSIALTNNPVPASEGVLRYSTDNGATYQDVPTNLTDKNALVLGKDVLLKFVPAQNFNGATPVVSARLIDSSTALYSDNHGAYAGQDVSVNGGATSISTDVASTDIRVSSVNNAPVATQPSISPVLSENGAYVTTVQTLMGSLYNDSADQQQTALNPTGSVAKPFGGIMLTGTGTTAAGVWSYTQDGVTRTIGDIAPGTTLFLDKTVTLHFTPALNYNGDAKGLVANLVSGSVTTGTAALPERGGQTDISANTVSVNPVITPVIQPPVVDMSPTQSTTPFGATASLTISDVIHGYNDTANQQRTVDNPNGTVASPLGGMVITGVATGKGVWSYTIDGVKTDIPDTVSSFNALVLPSNATLSFVPNPGFVGQASLMVAAYSAGQGTVGSLTGASIAQMGGILMGVNTQGSTAISASHDVVIIVSAPEEVPTTPKAPQLVPPYVGGRPILSVSTLRNGMAQDALNGYGRSSDVLRLSDVVDNDISLLKVTGVQTSWNSGTMNAFSIENAIVATGPVEAEARMEDGTPLPSWLSFDDKTMSFTGSPPDGTDDFVVRVDIRSGNLYDSIRVTFMNNDSTLLLDEAFSRIMRDQVLIKRIGQSTPHQQPNVRHDVRVHTSLFGKGQHKNVDMSGSRNVKQ